jgi:hypothetical protein
MEKWCYQEDSQDHLHLPQVWKENNRWTTLQEVQEVQLKNPRLEYMEMRYFDKIGEANSTQDFIAIIKTLTSNASRSVFIKEYYVWLKNRHRNTPIDNLETYRRLVERAIFFACGWNKSFNNDWYSILDGVYKQLSDMGWENFEADVNSQPSIPTYQLPNDCPHRLIETL